MKSIPSRSGHLQPRTTKWFTMIKKFRPDTITYPVNNDHLLAHSL
jgi:hypothetical protein